MKKTYRKNRELTEKTNMGYATLADELCMDQWNEKLAQVVGLGFATPSYTPSGTTSVKAGAPASLRMEDINESVANITNGLRGLYEGFEGTKATKAKEKISIETLAGLTESKAQKLVEEDEKKDDKEVPDVLKVEDAPVAPEKKDEVPAAPAPAPEVKKEEAPPAPADDEAKAKAKADYKHALIVKKAKTDAVEEYKASLGESKTITEATDAVWKQASKGIEKGGAGYLETLLIITKAFGMKDEVQLLSAMKQYQKSAGYKPHGYDILLDDMARGVIFDIKKTNPTDAQWASIVWGIPYDAIKEYDLIKFRNV